MTKKVKKVFELALFLEPLALLPAFHTRRMFGGLAIYIENRMVLVLMESEDDLDWNGVLLPTSREHHAALKKKWPKLVPHKILPKWLYLSRKKAKAGFEHIYMDIIQSISQQVQSASPEEERVFGILKKEKTKASLPIGQARNLGKVTARELKSVGIHTLGDLKKFGWKKACKKWVENYPARSHLMAIYAVIGAIEDIDVHDLSEAQRNAALVFKASL